MAREKKTNEPDLTNPALDQALRAFNELQLLDWARNARQQRTCTETQEKRTAMAITSNGLLKM